MSENVIVVKSFRFAVDIVNLYKYITTTKKEFILSKQLLKSGTSIGANVSEGVNGISKADFRSKLSIAFKEAKETEYWIALMVTTNILSKEETNNLKKSCDEICRILSSILKKCNSNIN